MRARLAVLLAACVIAPGCAALGIATGCDGTEIYGEFAQVGDLVENSNVQSSDVVIGTVKEIQLDKEDWNAVVRMCLEPGEQVSADAVAQVRSTSLLGEKFIDLQTEENNPPFLENGDVIRVSRTGKASELEEVFTKLANILGAGNLEQLNRFTSAQARILEGRETDLRDLLSGLRKFTGILAERKVEIAGAIDSLDNVAKTVLDDSDTLQRFLESFAGASSVLADQKNALEDLVLTLDRFSNVAVQLLNQTEQGLNKQFLNLRPVLRTAAANAENIRRTLETLATFAQWFPETMPGDYLQLDVCQAHEDDYDEGTNCPQAIGNDNPRSSAGSARSSSSSSSAGSLQFILNQPLGGRDS